MYCLVCGVDLSADIDAEISAADREIDFLVKFEDRSYEAEFEDGFIILIVHQHVRHPGSDLVNKSSRRKPAVLISESSLVLNRGAGAGKDHMHCHVLRHSSLIHSY